MPVSIGDLHQELSLITCTYLSGAVLPVRVLSGSELFNVNFKNNSIVRPGTHGYMQERSLYAVYGNARHGNRVRVVLVGMSAGGYLHIIAVAHKYNIDDTAAIADERLVWFADDNIKQECQIHHRWTLGDIRGLPGIGRKPHFKMALEAIKDGGDRKRIQALLRQYRDGHRASLAYHLAVGNQGPAHRASWHYRSTLTRTFIPYGEPTL